MTDIQVSEGLLEKLDAAPNGGGADASGQKPLLTDIDGIARAQRAPEKSYAVAIPTVPVTYERIPYVPRAGDPLEDPGTARANVAASVECPNGTEGWVEKHKDKTVLQQHVVYWDPDNDGIIWPQDTYNGVRAWGWAIPLSFFTALVIHASMSYPSAPTFVPDPFFRIWVARMHKNKHGSNSASFDTEGRWRAQSFEDIFSKYDRGEKGGLDASDLLRALKGQRLAYDFFGWVAAAFEWLATYLLLWPSDGVLRKEDVRRVFDGSIFQDKAIENQQRRKRMGLSG